jgi:hypothetical protein
LSVDIDMSPNCPVSVISLKHSGLLFVSNQPIACDKSLFFMQILFLICPYPAVLPPS